VPGPQSLEEQKLKQRKLARQEPGAQQLRPADVRLREPWQQPGRMAEPWRWPDACLLMRLRVRQPADGRQPGLRAAWQRWPEFAAARTQWAQQGAAEERSCAAPALQLQARQQRAKV
jgi:hypothetical protein